MSPPRRRPARSSLVAVAAVVLAALPANAQTPGADNAGFGGSYVDVALDALTGSVLNLGVAVRDADGHLFVSATGVGAVPPHQIHEFDARGAFVRSFAALAYRDLGFDRERVLVGVVDTQRAAIAPFARTAHRSIPSK